MDPIVFTQRVADAPPPSDAVASVALDFEARRRRRQPIVLADGRAAWIALERLDEPLAEGDQLVNEAGLRLIVRAAPERLLAVAATGVALARCAYHLGNRHALVEVAPDGLRTPYDGVMRAMLEQLGASVAELTAPFNPEIGAYHHGADHDHGHGPSHGAGHAGKIHRFVLRP